MIPSGLGTDIADISPFRLHPFASHESFYRLVFTEAERAYCLSRADPAPHFAARFAAKEAALKAASGLLPLAIPQIEVARDALTGKPALRLVSRRGEALPDSHLHFLVSLSHGANYALASVFCFEE